MGTESARAEKMPNAKEHPEVSAEIDKIVRDTLVVEPEPFEDTVIAKNEEDNE